MATVVVVGGGIAGLAAASRLVEANPELTVQVLEAADRVGGKLRRVEVAGVGVDVGAEALLARRPEGLELIGSAGLSAELRYPLTTAALLRSEGQNHPLPAKTLLGIPSDLASVRKSGVLSEVSLATIAAEPALGPYPPLGGDVSVGDVVAQRFGTEVVDRLVDPLLGGVYAGHAHRISLQAAIPTLAYRLIEQGESLLTAARAVVSAGARDDGSPVFASLAGGLARLPERLAANPRLSVRTSSTVRAVRRTPTGFTLTVGSVPQSLEIECDALVIAVPAGKSASLLADIVPLAAAELADIEMASMVIVTLAFEQRALSEAGGLPAGSGLLIPQREALAVKAMTFTSQKWPDVGADRGLWLMRASLGRAGQQGALQRADPELVDIVRAELAEVTGVSLAPVDWHVQRWGGALPQYDVGHIQKIGRIRSSVAQVPGLAVCGASYDGVGLPACIASALLAADRVLSHLSNPAQ